MNYYVNALKNYATFSGRARRKEYWMFFLFNLIFSAVAGILDMIIGLDGMLGLTALYSLATFIPRIAVSVRRLHDIGKTGWWYFIVLIPLIGSIWYLILMCTDSKYGTNTYGENPKGIN